jgi:hypothetical protein
VHSDAKSDPSRSHRGRWIGWKTDLATADSLMTGQPSFKGGREATGSKGGSVSNQTNHHIAILSDPPCQLPFYFCHPERVIQSIKGARDNSSA